MGFAEKYPMEALIYYRLLVQRDIDKDPRRKKFVQTIADFISSKNHVEFFFDNTREAEKHAKQLKHIVGEKSFREIVLDLARRLIKTDLKQALRLLDLIEAYEQVLRLIVDEEYENLKKISKSISISAPNSIPHTMEQESTPTSEVLKDILSKYEARGILNAYSSLAYALNFVKKIHLFV